MAARGIINENFFSMYTPLNSASAVMGATFGGCGSSREKAAARIMAMGTMYRDISSPHILYLLYSVPLSPAGHMLRIIDGKKFRVYNGCGNFKTIDDARS